MFKIIKGNLFENIPEQKPVVIAHVCNTLGKMGAGFVIPLAEHFPKVRERYLALGEWRLGHTQIVQVENDSNIWVANMIAQQGVGHDAAGRPPIRYVALVDCMREVARYVHNGQVICPKFGSGLAGADWSFIESLIQEIWIDAGIPVTVFELE